MRQLRLSASAPATVTSSNLLGSFEESVLNGRLEPVSTVEGFTAEIGASGSFHPKHRTVPVTVFFYTLCDNNTISSPYLGKDMHVNYLRKLWESVLPYISFMLILRTWILHTCYIKYIFLNTTCYTMKKYAITNILWLFKWRKSITFNKSSTPIYVWGLLALCQPNGRPIATINVLTTDSSHIFKY